MSLDHAILGFLNYHPYTGYDLKKVFDTSVKHFWPADQSQIYRTLNRLTDQGFAEMEVERQEDRPDRKVYQITESGREELKTWLAGPPPMSSPRSAPLIQVFFSGMFSDEQLLEKFRGFAAQMRAILDGYNQIPDLLRPYQEEISSEREHFFWLLTLESGIRNLEANLAWAESIIQRLETGEVPQN